jgi:ADP-heptose:LPS heptosyltransferase
MQELSQTLYHDHGFATVLIGGAECRGQVSVSSTHLIDTTGVLSLRELLGVIDGSRLVISTDSGPFHIAGALQRPLIGLFRSSRPEHAERYAQSTVVYGRDESCRTACKWDYCQSSTCLQLQNIPTSRIVEVLMQKLRVPCESIRQ